MVKILDRQGLDAKSRDRLDRPDSTRTPMAKTIRSKNVGVDKITFDVIFRDRASYDRVRLSGALSRAAVCHIFRIDEAQITDHVEFDPAMAIKFTIYRRMPSGQPRRRRHLRQPAIWPAARHRSTGRLRRCPDGGLQIGYRWRADDSLLVSDDALARRQIPWASG